MAHRFEIVVEKSGQKAPDDFLRMMIAQCNTCFGAASVNDKGEIEVFRASEPCSMEVLEALHEKYLNNRRVLVFGKSDTAMRDEDVQPYVMMKVPGGEGEEDTDIVLSFLSGDYGSHAKKDSNIPATYFANEEVLVPLAELMVGEAKGDLGEFVNTLSGATVGQEIIKLISTGGSSVVLLATNQEPGGVEPFYFTSGDREKEFPWGWTSDHLDYGKVEEKPPATKGKMVLQLKGKKDEQKTEGSPEPDKETKKVEEAPKQPDQQDPGQDYEYIQPPGDVRGPALEQWYKDNTMNGKLPDKWATRVSIRVKKKSGTKMGEQLKGMQKLPQKLTADKDQIPVVSEAELKAYEAEFVKGKFKDMTGKPVPNPFQMQGYEEKLPSFEEVLKGFKLDNIASTYTWPLQAHLYLREKCPNLYTAYTKALLTRLVEAEAELHNLSTIKKDADKKSPVLQLKKKSA